MVYLVNSRTNATSKRLHLCEIDLMFALNSTPGRDEPDWANRAQEGERHRMCYTGTSLLRNRPAPRTTIGSYK